MVNLFDAVVYIRRYKMTDAEATIRFVVLSAIAETYEEAVESMVDKIMEKLFDPSVRWAINEYLKEDNE